jgi:hypothetical protein
MWYTGVKDGSTVQEQTMVFVCWSDHGLCWYVFLHYLSAGATTKLVQICV